MDYMTPLGLHHLMARGHHYGPGPWVAGGPRADWTSVYYHRADRDGIGFDRSATRQQCGRAVRAAAGAPVRRSWSTVPEKFLLWFHHVPWDYRTRVGTHAVGRARASLHPRAWPTCTRCARPGMAWATTSTPSATPRSPRSWPSRRRKRSGGATPASPTSRRSRAGRCRQGYAPPAHTLDYYESLAFPYAPGQ